jgi:peroxiredoxin Q/BCP
MIKLLSSLAAGAAGLAAAAFSCHGGSNPLPVGSATPDLAGVDQSGNTHRLADSRGKPTLVYFYPKDDTPGCTKEACAFRDVWQEYRAAGVRLLGVSQDDQQSHAKFAEKYHLPFPLIADPQGDWGKAFGVATRVGTYARVSFLVGEDGKVAKVYPKVDPGVHATQVLADVAALR